MSPRGVHHLAIKVRDLALMEAFYRDVLGLRPLQRWPRADGTGDRSSWLDTGDGGFIALEVAEAPAGQGADPETGGHYLLALRISVRERAAWKKRLLDAGVAIDRESAYTLYFTDPEKNRLGLSHHPDPEEGE